MLVTDLDEWLVGAEFHCVNCLYLRHSVSCQTHSSDDAHIVSAWYRKSSHFWEPLWKRTDSQPGVPHNVASARTVQITFRWGRPVRQVKTAAFTIAQLITRSRSFLRRCITNADWKYVL